MKNMLNFKEFTADELMDILNLALDMKKNPEKYSESLKGKKLYTLFEKTSTRTFLSFATGITELGGTYYNQLWKDSNFVLGEPVSEIKYVCRNVDIIMARLIKNETVELFGKNATVPFINGCDNSYHPCQILADALTILEKFGTLDVNLIKIGLANIVTIVVLCKLGLADAVLVSALRIFLSSLLFGNFTVMIYSLAGAAVSMLFMWISVKLGFFSTTGTSILGGVGHNVGQLIVAYLVIKNQNILIYAPFLLVSGTIAGVLIGLAAAFVIRAVGGQIGKF